METFLESPHVIPTQGKPTKRNPWGLLEKNGQGNLPALWSKITVILAADILCCIVPFIIVLWNFKMVVTCFKFLPKIIRYAVQKFV